jgi:3'(2'), 5'-bisphosphate nucleotidase
VSVDSKLLSEVVALARHAGDAILGVYGQQFEVTNKADQSPLTLADTKSHDIIVHGLRTLTPQIPVLSEEASDIPYSERRQWQRYWLVDPLDGTKEFVSRNGEFTVNIALCERDGPIAGVVLAPTTGATWWGSPAGAFEARLTDGTLSPATPITVDESEPLRIVASRSHGHRALGDLMETFGITDDVSVGSSLKFCLLATGAAQLYPRFGPTCEWDTAAGQAVLEAAGGVVLTLDGTPMRYGKVAENFLNPYFAAAASESLGLRAAAEMSRLLHG